MSTIFSHIKQKARHVAFGSVVYNWTLGGATPDTVSVIPTDTWPGDAAHAREVIAAMAADGYKPVRLGTGPL